MSDARWRLNAMMFLEFFIWGAWLPLIFGYLPSLGFSTGQQSWVLNAFTIGSFPVHWYGICYAVGLAAVYLVLVREARRRGQNAELVGNAMVIVAIAALIGRTDGR